MLDGVLTELKALGDGLATVQRVVCGDCLDFKITTKLPVDKLGAWEEASFAPEVAVLEKMGSIDGITNVETQTFTLEQL